MQDQINQIIETQRSQGEKQDKMYEALLGNEFTKGEGLIHAIEKNTEYRKNDTKQKYYITGAVGAIMFFFGIFKKAIVEFLTS